jgi:hypothetical protein
MGGAVPSAAAAQHQGAPAFSGVSAPDSSSAAGPSGGVPVAAEGGAAGGGGEGGGMSMMGGMGGMRGGQGGGDVEYKSKLRLNSDPKDIFGKVERTAPRVIGDE